MAVPKRIFFYWGNNKMSWMRYMTLESFRRMNPSWEMVLYVSQHNINYKTWKQNNYQDFFCYHGANYIDRIHSLNIDIRKLNQHEDITPSHASNFLKWQMLATEGGIYSDMDILYFKPMDKFYESLKNCDTAICQTDFLSIGLLASSGSNAFFEDIHNNTFKSFSKDRYQSAGVETIYLLYSCHQSEVLANARLRYPDLTFFNIPMNLIYFLNSKQVNDAFYSPVNEFPDKAIGYHWYAGHRTSQVFNNILTEDNYIKYNTLFSKIIFDFLN